MSSCYSTKRGTAVARPSSETGTVTNWWLRCGTTPQPRGWTPARCATIPRRGSKVCEACQASSRELRDAWQKNDDYRYIYRDDYLYQVDPTTQVIQALVALVSGQQFGIGQPMPVGYSTYNVPLAYRDQYYDTADSWYRYNNGNIYQVDPKTQLVTALIRAII